MNATLFKGAKKRRVVAPDPGGGALALTLAGASQSLSYSEPLGRYPSGNARMLYVQFTRSMTYGSPVLGTLTTPGRTIDVAAHRWGSGTASTLVSLAVPLQDGDIPAADIAACTTGTWTDDSATWENANTSGWDGEGLPAGALVATSAAHLCAASPFLPLVPKATQPSFTGSAAVDDAFDFSLTNVIRGWSGGYPDSGSSSYETVAGLMRAYLRSSDVEILKTTLSLMAKVRTDYFFGSPPESRVVFETQMLMYLFRRDQEALDLVASNAEVYLIIPRTSSYPHNAWDDYPTGPRIKSIPLRRFSVMAKCGLADTEYYGLTVAEHAEFWIDKCLESPGWETDGMPLVKGFESDGETSKRVAYAFQSGIMYYSIVDLCDAIPTLSNKATALARVAASLVLERTEMSSTSENGTTQIDYATGDLYNPESELIAGTTGDYRNTVDLLQFSAWAYAWRAWNQNSVTDANKARALFIGTGVTPRGGVDGPNLGTSGNTSQNRKVSDGCWWLAWHAPAYLEAAGV